MYNETGLEEIIADVQFDIQRGKPCVCQKCNEHSENILSITANVIYHHPGLKGQKEDRIVSVWRINGCKWCIDRMFGTTGKLPPGTKYIVPTLFPQAQ
jgi:hypothetical protein